MNIDFKIITWERVEVPAELEEKAIEMLKSGKVKTSNDLFDGLEALNYHVLPEVEQQLSVDENDGDATIEALLDGKTIYKNGK